jgi:hypothetical protein
VGPPVVVLVSALLALAPAPELRVEAPPELAQVAGRLRSTDAAHLQDVSRLVGLETPGPPVRVVLVDDASPWAREVPSWVTGVALGTDLIVLFPHRAPIYPHGTLEDVLRHELAHVLIARASGGASVPRWFNEGLAMAAERPWGLTDRTRLALGLAFGSPLTLAEVDRLFRGGREEQAQAYAIAGWFVRDLIDEHGTGMPATLLRHLDAATSFDRAYARATGTTLVMAEAEFFRRQRRWTTWFPLLTSTTVLWAGIAVLVLLAYRRRRQRRAELWKVEEVEEVEEVSGEVERQVAAKRNGEPN